MKFMNRMFLEQMNRFSKINKFKSFSEVARKSNNSSQLGAEILRD